MQGCSNVSRNLETGGSISKYEGDNVPPRFSLPRIKMRTVLEPELIINPCQIIASIPPAIERISFDTKSNICRLPFREKDGAAATILGSRSIRPKKVMSQIDRKRDEQSKAKLNRQLHDEHRVFFSNLKLERQKKFRIDTMAALVIQRHVRGYMTRRELNPEKYMMVRSSLQRRWTKEEVFAMAEEAIRRCGLVLD